MRWFIFAATACALSLSSSLNRLRGGDLDLGIVDPIGKVGDIGKVGAIDKPTGVTGPTGAPHPPADTGYLVCWNWNVAKEPAWRCTQQLADLPQAREFSNYQNWRYDLGQSFFLPVFKKDWADPASRKVVMDRVRKGAIPKAMEWVAVRDDQPGRNPERAALIRKQIQSIRPNWVDVTPVLPKGVKAADATGARKGTYDDAAIIPNDKLPKDPAQEAREAAARRADEVERSTSHDLWRAKFEISGEASEARLAVEKARTEAKLKADEIDYKILKGIYHVKPDEYKSFLDARDQKDATFEASKDLVNAVETVRYRHAHLVYTQKNLNAWTPPLGAGARDRWASAMADARARYEEDTKKARQSEEKEKAAMEKSKLAFSNLMKHREQDRRQSEQAKTDESDEIDKVRKALRGELDRLNRPR